MCVCAIAVYAKPVVVQKMILKNGTVLNGYIERQEANGRITFHSESAVVYLNSQSADIHDRSVNIRALDQKWVKWAEKNDAFEGIGDGRTFMLNDIVIRTLPVMADSVAVSDKDDDKGFDYYLQHNVRMISNVKVLENGVHVKYMELTPNTYYLSWDDVEAIRADKRPKNMLSGINRVYQLRNGRTYEGQYAGETDNTLSLYMDNGIMQTLNTNDVIKYTFKPVNPNQTIFEQSELLDLVRTKKQGNIRGIIIEQNYSSRFDTDNYILIRQESGSIQSVKIADIVETCKEQNPKYTPKLDIILKDGEVVVNRRHCKYVDIKETKDVLVLDSLGNKLIFEKSKDGATPITVEYRLLSGSNVETFQLVRLTKAQVKKSTVYTFSYRDLVNNIYRPRNIETSVNHTTKAEYFINGTGEYVLYDAKNHKGIPFVVK